MAKTMARLTGSQMKLIFLVLVYVSGNSFGADAAGMALNLGADSGDTLKEMFKRKMSM